MQPNEVSAALERVRRLERPVLSVYADVDPVHDRSNQAARIRCKNTFKASGDVPEALVEGVLHAFDEPVRSRFRVVFANAEEVEVIDLPVRVIDDSGSDKVLQHFGEPYLLPLLAALADHPRCLVIAVDRDHLRVFDTFLGEIELVAEKARETVAEEEDTPDNVKTRFSAGISRVNPTHARSSDTASNRQNGPSYVANRSGGAVQLAAEHIEHAQRAFYRESAKDIDAIMQERRVEHAIVVGPERSAHAFAASVPESLAQRIEALMPAPADAPKESSLLALVDSTLLDLAQTRKRDLLHQVAESGLHGVGPCLQALQEGRLKTLVVSEHLKQSVFYSTDGEHVALRATAARDLDPRGEIEEVELADVLPRLTSRWGTRLECVRGDAAPRLEGEFGGMAGVRRY